MTLTCLKDLKKWLKEEKKPSKKNKGLELLVRPLQMINNAHSTLK